VAVVRQDCRVSVGGFSVKMVGNSYFFLYFSYEQESKTQFVVDAVFAFAYALHNLHYDLCIAHSPKPKPVMSQQRIHNNNKIGVCQEMVNYDGYDFYKNYLLNVSFIGE
jgi:metabotropic glutamate receptor 3